MFKRYELHNHTNESDAPISCAELAAMMAQEGVHRVFLCPYIVFSSQLNKKN